MEGGGYTVVSWVSEATTFFFLPALSDLLSSFFSLLPANSDAFIHVLILCFLTGSTAVIARAASFAIMPQRVGNGSCLVASTYYCTCVDAIQWHARYNSDLPPCIYSLQIR